MISYHEVLVSEARYPEIEWSDFSLKLNTRTPLIFLAVSKTSVY